jgi:hypothetical protein
MSSSTKLCVALGLVSAFVLLLGARVAKADVLTPSGAVTGVLTPTAIVYRSVDDPDIYAADGDTEAEWGAAALIDGAVPNSLRTPMCVMQDDTSDNPKTSPTDPITGYLVFDLGAKHPLTGAMIWGRDNSNATVQDPLGPKNVSFFTYSGDTPHGFAVSTDIASDSTVSMLTTQDLTSVPSGQATTVAFSANARYVGMVINSSFGATNCQMFEVAFNSPDAVVPEPSSIVIMVSGLIGLVCYAWRKR